MRIRAIDPSGSFLEGKGTTGWIVLEDDKIRDFGQIKAKHFDSRQSYWKAHEALCEPDDIDIVVLEDFRLYQNKMKPQINSEMETSKMIGYLQMKLWENDVPVETQLAVQAKKRFNDKILINKGYITKDSNGRYFINGLNVPKHIIDALRHALFYSLKLRKGKVG